MPEILKSRNYRFFAFIVLFYLGLVWYLFPARWETNDDIAMSMVAHGYGLSAESSARIIFSNVIWGFVVKSIPNIGGVVGYSVATALTIWIALSCIAYFLDRLKLSFKLNLLIIFAIGIVPALFPQFTINSGLVSIAGILGILVYFRDREISILGLATFLCYVAFLIRSQEFLLVLLLALPTMPFLKLIRDKKFKIALFILGSTIFGSVIVDQKSYQSDAWLRFKDFNVARAPYTDFAIAPVVKSNGSLIKKFSYTENDISLIQNFFFADPQIANAQSLLAMFKEVAVETDVSASLKLGFTSFYSLLNWKIFPFFVLSLGLFLLKPRWNTSIIFGLFLLVIFLMGFLGRGEVIRVYVPLTYFLLIISILNCDFLQAGSVVWGRDSNLKWTIVAAFFGLNFVYTFISVMPDVKKAITTINDASLGLTKLPKEMVVSWGVGIPIESIYPLFSSDEARRKLEIYPFGVFTLAPFSISYREENNGNGFIKRIRSQEGVLMVSLKHQFDLLEIWCHERFNGILKQEFMTIESFTDVRRVTCLSKETA